MLCSTKAWRKIPKGIWVTDEWSANFFHWMTDCLPRIWEGIERDATFPIILPDSYRSLEYVTQSLNLLKIKVEFFKSRENLRVETLILTARTATFPNFNPSLTQKTREKFAVSTPKTPWKKVYVSRKHATKRKAHNELEVELMLRKKGFDIVYAEQLSIKEQAKLMGNTMLLVCLHGAALTNMLFLKENMRVLELRKIGDTRTNCYFNLASALGLRYYYTLNKGDHRDTIMTDFTIDLIALETVIDQIEKE